MKLRHRCAVIAFLLLPAFAISFGIQPGSAWGDEKDELSIPAPQDVSLDTRDGVQLRCTYYPGGVQQVDKDKFRKISGKEVVPVLLVHGWGGQRGDYDELALGLQRLGHAVIVPDLRGHGASTVQKIPGRADTRSLDPARMNKADLAAMVLGDLETVKGFLLKENNSERLNIEMLCVVASEVGAIVALNWALQDWSWPQLPTIKQGQDIKALVLVSPVRQFKGASPELALRNPAIQRQLSVMIVTGRQSSDYSDSKRLFNHFEKYHAPPPKDPKEQAEKQTLYFFEPDTSLSGTELIKGPGLRVDQLVAGFIFRRLVSKRDQFKWESRGS